MLMRCCCRRWANDSTRRSISSSTAASGYLMVAFSTSASHRLVPQLALGRFLGLALQPLAQLGASGHRGSRSRPRARRTRRSPRGALPASAWLISTVTWAGVPASRRGRRRGAPCRTRRCRRPWRRPGARTGRAGLPCRPAAPGSSAPQARSSGSASPCFAVAIRWPVIQSPACSGRSIGSRRARSLRRLLDGLVDVLVRDGLDLTLEVDVVVVAQLDGGLQRHGDRQPHRLGLHVRDARHAVGLDLLFLECPLHQGRSHVLRALPGRGSPRRPASPPRCKGRGPCGTPVSGSGWRPGGPPSPAPA